MRLEFWQRVALDIPDALPGPNDERNRFFDELPRKLSRSPPPRRHPPSLVRHLTWAFRAVVFLVGRGATWTRHSHSRGWTPENFFGSHSGGRRQQRQQQSSSSSSSSWTNPSTTWQQVLTAKSRSKFVYCFVERLRHEARHADLLEQLNCMQKA